VPTRAAEWIEKDHGRIETRRCVVTDDLSLSGGSARLAGVKTLVMVEATVTSTVMSTELRYNQSRLADAEHMGTIVRGHWGVENGPALVARRRLRRRPRRGCVKALGGKLFDPATHCTQPDPQDKSVKVGAKRRLMARWDDA